MPPRLRFKSNHGSTFSMVGSDIVCVFFKLIIILMEILLMESHEIQV